jgi:hypothetical protein
MQEIAKTTGIQVGDGFRYLGVQIRTSYKGSRDASYEVVQEGITAKCSRLYASKVDLFYIRQIIKTVVIPLYNHIFMSFGPCEEDRPGNNKVTMEQKVPGGGGVAQKGKKVGGKK